MCLGDCRGGGGSHDLRDAENHYLTSRRAHGYEEGEGAHYTKAEAEEEDPQGLGCQRRCQGRKGHPQVLHVSLGLQCGRWGFGGRGVRVAPSA